MILRIASLLLVTLFYQEWTNKQMFNAQYRIYSIKLLTTKS